MNILFLYRIYPSYGGVEVVTTILANRFVRDGHSCCIVSFEQPQMHLLNHLESNIKLYKLEYPVLSYSNIQKLKKIIKEHKVDIIINQWGLPFYTTTLCKLAITNGSTKLISVLHGSPYTSKVILKSYDAINNSEGYIPQIYNRIILKIKEYIIKKGLKYNLKNNSKYILLSDGFILPMMDYINTSDTSNILAIGNPITIKICTDNFDDIQKKQQILYVGRMDYENKRVNRIISAWEKIHKEYPDWELVLVGDGPHKEELKQYVKNSHIERVNFYPFQKEQPIQFFKDASIFMLTSDLEGFGLVIIEGMNYGVVPIVYGSYEAVYDIISHEKDGFITPKPYNEEITIEYLKRLINDKEMRYRMAKNAIETSKKFSEDSIVTKWYNLFEEVLTKS